MIKIILIRSFGVILLLLGLTSIIFGFKYFESFQTQSNDYVKASATITNITTYQKPITLYSRGITTHTTTTGYNYSITFNDVTGSKINTIINLESIPTSQESGLAVGSKTTIVYPKSNPTDAGFSGDTATFNGAYIFFGIGALLAFMGGWLAFTKAQI